MPRLQVPSLFGYQPGRPELRRYSPEEQRQGATKHMWMIFCGALAMFTNAGLAMMKAGSCRVRSVQHVFLLCLWDVCMGTMAWWIVGYAFALSGPYDSLGFKDSLFMGWEKFAGHTFLQERASDGQLEPSNERIGMWFFTWAVSTVATSIVSGGLAERRFAGYSIYVFLSSCFIFPIIVAWTWGRGFLAEMNVPGYQDFAGSGVVHMTGGFCALAGAVVAGQRPGRFAGQSAKERVREIPEHFTPHSQPLVVFGALTAWCGWYGLNCGFVMEMTSIEKGMLAAQVAMNTTLAAAFSGLTAFLIQFLLKRKNDIDGLCFGVLAGIAAISAGCASVDTGSAVGIGVVAGILYPMFSALLKTASVDDPVDAFAVHGVCGAWGLIALSLMDWGTGFEKTHAHAGFRCIGAGLYCYEGGGGSVVAAAFAGIGAIIAWAFFLSLIFFAVLRIIMKHKPEVENEGVDRSLHIPEMGYHFGIPSSASMALHSI